MALQMSELPIAVRGPVEILARCSELVRPELRAAVDRLHPWPRRMAGFSFGWCDVDGVPTADGGGKGVRQALAILSAEAVGAPVGTAVTGAVAVELVHAFSLMHDDIMDGDEVRRSRAAVWKAYGTGPAVLAGDALFALAFETVANAAGSQGGAAIRLISAASTELVRGQAEDIEFERRPWCGPHAVTLDEYRTMAQHKTGALLACAAAIGAVSAGAPPQLVSTLSAVGRHLGLAFQVADDILGIWGDPAVTGKAVHRDLRNRKKTLPVLLALDSGTSAGRHLAELLSGADTLGEDALRFAADLTDQAGGRDRAVQEAQRHLEQATDLLAQPCFEVDAAAQLSVLARFAVDRSC